MARDCTIRHPVLQIVALQRRVRFSARLAGFCRDRCHQRRARRAEEASFSVFVSNLDFRVPRLRQREERATQSGQLRHCRDGWVFPRGWRGFPGSGGTKDAPEGLNGPHFGISSLISIFECHVCAKVGSGPLTGPSGGGKEGHPRGPESRPGLPRRSGLARSGPGAARAWIQVSARERDIPLLDGVFPARTGNPNRRHRLRHAPELGLATGR